MSVIYARIAKYAVLMLIAMCVLSLLTLAVTKTGKIHDLAAIVFFFVILPSLSLGNFFLDDPVKNALLGYDFEPNAEIREVIRPLLDKVDANVRVVVYQSEEINAFAISSLTGRSAAIGFSSGLVRTADREEFYAIAAHEVAHVRNGDSKNKLYILAFHNILEFFPNLLSMLAKSFLASYKWAICFFVLVVAFLVFASGLGQREAFLWALVKVGWPVPTAIVSAWAVKHILHQAFLAYSRGREYVADADGAHLTSPEMMMRALNFLPDDERDGHGIFDSHPPLKERKRRIAELQDAPARQEPAIVELVGNDT